MHRPKWLACVGLLSVCAACRADVINYSFNGSWCSPFPGGGCFPAVFDFQIATTAVPEISGTTYYGQTFFDFGADQVAYSSASFVGGDVLFAGDTLNFASTIGSDYFSPGIFFEPVIPAALYSGSITSPTLLTGDYGFTRGVENGGDVGYSGTLVVSDINSPVTTPEPSGLVLLGTGACALFGAGWRRARRP